MSAVKKLTLDEAHLHFAKQTHGRVWDLIDMQERTKSEAEEMLHAAHASLYHWLHAGTGLHKQRGEWLISRVHAVLGNGQEALRHAERCAELTKEHADLMQDFDKAFSLECLARAHAVLGDKARATQHMELAGRRVRRSPTNKTARYLSRTSMAGTGMGPCR